MVLREQIFKDIMRMVGFVNWFSLWKGSLYMRYREGEYLHIEEYLSMLARATQFNGLVYQRKSLRHGPILVKRLKRGHLL